MKPRPDIVTVDQPWKRAYRTKYPNSCTHPRRLDCLDEHWRYEAVEDRRYLHCAQCDTAFLVMGLGDLEP